MRLMYFFSVYRCLSLVCYEMGFNFKIFSPEPNALLSAVHNKDEVGAKKALKELEGGLQYLAMKLEANGFSFLASQIKLCLSSMYG